MHLLDYSTQGRYEEGREEMRRVDLKRGQEIRSKGKKGKAERERNEEYKMFGMFCSYGN